jgi:hypothetical protein
MLDFVVYAKKETLVRPHQPIMQSVCGLNGFPDFLEEKETFKYPGKIRNQESHGLLIYRKALVLILWMILNSLQGGSMSPTHLAIALMIIGSQIAC